MAQALFIFVLANFVQAISSQYIGNNLCANGLIGNIGGRGYDGYNHRLGYGNVPSSFGGGFTVTSTSPIAPTGLIVTSENAIEGSVTVIGNLPFIGAVATDGSFPTAGAGTISYGCGGGSVGIISESFISPIVGDLIVPAVSSTGRASFPRGLWGGFRRCGCRGIY